MNKKIRFQNISTLILLLILLTIPGCPLIGDLTGSYGDEYFRIKVDSVYVPSSVPSSSDIPIKLWGSVGKDSCYIFSHFQSGIDKNEMDLTPWGYHKYTYRVICSTGDIKMDGKLFNITHQDTGIFYIRIHQPDGTVIKKEVNIY